MKFAARTLLFASLSPIALAAPASAQENQAAAQTPAQAATDNPDEQTIVVTGTRRTDRTVADSPVPVDVIGSEAIANTGQTETNKILNQLVPSFNFPQPSIADGTDALRPATLARPQPRPDLGAGQRQAPPRLGAAQHQRHGRPRQRRRRSQPHPGPGDRPGRSAARRRARRNMARTRSPASSTSSSRTPTTAAARALTYGKYYTTIDDVANITGLQLDAAGQPQPRSRRQPLLPRATPTASARPATGRRRPSAPTSACRSAPAASSTSPPNIATATDQPRRLRPPAQLHTGQPPGVRPARV